MRIGCIAIVGLLSAFSPPPCQKVNADFMRDDAGGTDSGADAGMSTEETAGPAATGEASTTIEMPTGGAVETTASDDDTGGGESSETSQGTTQDGPCPQPGEELCGGVCVDTTSDRDHCGMCGMKCHPVQQVCEDSLCVPS